jgi:hypothetical protein
VRVLVVRNGDFGGTENAAIPAYPRDMIQDQFWGTHEVFVVCWMELKLIRNIRGGVVL